MGDPLTVTVLGRAGTYPGPGDACSGYLLRAGGANVVVDLGAGTLANLQSHLDLATLDAVVLTHEHPDHWLDLTLLRNAFRYVLGLGDLPVYGTAGTRHLAAALLDELEPTLAWHTIEPASSVALGPLDLRFGRTDHPVETLAVRVEAGGRTLLYSADTGPAWDPGDLGAGVDLLLCEASLRPVHEGEVQHHLSARQAGALARAMGAGRLVLTHLVPGVDPDAQRADALAAFGGQVEVAATGATLAV
jgi:ribonuclease BN (tRNA processing enzyme)